MAGQKGDNSASGKDALHKYLLQTLAKLDADGGNLGKVALRAKVMPQVVEGVQRLASAAPAEKRDEITRILTEHQVLPSYSADAAGLAAALRLVDSVITGQPPPASGAPKSAKKTWEKTWELEPPPRTASGGAAHLPSSSGPSRQEALERTKSGERSAVSFTRSISAESGGSTGKFKHIFTPQHAGSLSSSYDIGELLGEGSFGNIHKARLKQESSFHIENGTADREEEIQCWRAIKTVSSEMTPARFEAEVRVQRQLDHPNIAKLYEVFKDDLKFYLVLELCTGGELFESVVEAGGTFNEDDCALYLQQVLAALNYLHKHQVAHRDLKPENLLFHSKDKEAPLKLIDFGCARTFTPGTAMTSCLGTPLYVAPEVLAFQYTEKCDVWSCGVIMYLLLCGEYPFFGKDEDAILKNIEAGSVDFDDDPWDDISDAAKDAITEMLRKDAAARPAAESLLDHNWFTSHEHRAQGSLPQSLVPKLQKFKYFSQFKKIALSVAAQCVQDESIKEMQDTFVALDKNKDGTLTHAEIIEGMKAHGLTLPEDFAEVLCSVDTDGSGTVDYTEFIASTLSRKQYLLEESLWNVFRTFDLDGDGRIQRDEFAKVVAMSDEADIARVFEETDLNGDNEIDFKEFCAMMRGNKDPSSPKGCPLSP